jgi:hypothetical protein
MVLSYSFSLTIAVGSIVLLASIALHGLVLVWHLQLNVPLWICRRLKTVVAMYFH